MLKLKNVSSGYNNKNVISNVSFEANKNELLCIIGPNGSGKSTLLKSIGNINPYEGSIKINDKEIKSINRKDLGKEIALMSQITELYFSYTVYDTIALGRYAHSKGLFSNLTSEDKDIIDNVIKELSIDDLKEKQINQLSGGQLQRVFLARVIVQDPKIILLDEPTNHLDFKHQIELLNHLREWVKDGERTVIAVLHDLNLVQMYADNVVLLKNGEIIKAGKKKEVLEESILREVYGMDIKKIMLSILEKWNEE